jgi:hypothetical protein
MAGRRSIGFICAIIGIYLGVGYAALTIGYINRASRWGWPRPPIAALQRDAYHKNSGHYGPVLSKDQATTFAYPDLAASIVIIISAIMLLVHSKRKRENILHYTPRRDGHPIECPQCGIVNPSTSERCDCGCLLKG